jgi:hypothetical protein
MCRLCPWMLAGPEKTTETTCVDQSCAVLDAGRVRRGAEVSKKKLVEGRHRKMSGRTDDIWFERFLAKLNL